MFRQFFYAHPLLFGLACRVRVAHTILWGGYVCYRGGRTLSTSLLFLPLTLLLYPLWSLIGHRRLRQFRREEEGTAPFPHELAIVAIAKNEAPYFAEWIEYHRLRGVSKFFIYDNDSTDHTHDVLSPYIADGLVEYIPFPGKHAQLKAYQDSLARVREVARYVAFIDLDEFIMTADPDANLPAWVAEQMQQHPHAGGIALSWLNFGSCGHIKRPQGLVLENYTTRGDDSFLLQVKTIANPRLIHTFINPHYPCYRNAAYNVNENGRAVYASMDPHKSTRTCWINHYFTRSREDFAEKMNKGIATASGADRTWEDFNKRDRNEVVDKHAVAWGAALREALARTARENTHA